MKKTVYLSVVLGILAGSTSHAALWQSGHGDIGIAYDQGLDEWEPHFHFHMEPGEEAAVINGIDNTQEEYGINELTIRVGGAKQTSAGVTDSGAATVYLLPETEGQSESLGNPWPGFAAEDEISTGVFVNDLLTLTLESVSGPGVFSLWNTDIGGDIVRMSSAPGSSAPDSLDLTIPTHAHYSLGFSEAGIYDVTYGVSGVLDQAGNPTSGTTFMVQYQVVPEPSTAMLGLLAGLGLLRRRRS